MPSSSFAGESFLQEPVPDFGSERQSLLLKIGLAFVVWTLVIPFLLAKEETVVDEGASAEVETKRLTDTESNGSTNKQTPKSQRKNKKQSRTPHKPSTAVTPSTSTPTKDNPTTTRVVDGNVNAACILFFVIHAIYLWLCSAPDNYFASRTVFEAPLFTLDECQHLVDMAERVASKNYQIAQQEKQMHQTNETTLNTTLTGFLTEPYGWQKQRHLSYPTTDLNLVTDPFQKEDRAWIQQRLDARLSPTLQRIFGVPPSAIRANDIFLVRYDGDRQASLSRHMDDGSITFSALLSDDFEGGGTRYWNRLEGDVKPNMKGEPFAYVTPKAGMMTAFPAVIEHEGVQTTKGRRYLLIGFLAVDQVDPWTRRSTGLSFFSSWGSLNWAAVKFKEGAKVAWREHEEGHSGESWLTSMEAGKFFQGAYEFFINLGDVLYTHRFSVLVNETASDEFLHALDAQYEQDKSRMDDASRRASWFSGQQIKVGIDGSLTSYWPTRDISTEKFQEL